MNFKPLLHFAFLILTLATVFSLSACDPELAEYQENDFIDRKVDASFLLYQTPDSLIEVDSIIIDETHHYYYSINSWVNYQLRLKVCCRRGSNLTPEQLSTAGFNYLWRTNIGRTSFNNNYTFAMDNTSDEGRLDFWLSDTLKDSLHFTFHFDINTSYVLDTLENE